MRLIRLALLVLVSCLSVLNAQTNGTDQPFNFVVPSTGGKFIEWYGKSGRSYFLQVSDPADHLNKWNWSTVIERGGDEWISYEVDSTAEKAFFRLQYTEQTATNLDTADFDGDGLTNLQEITPVIRPSARAARSIGGSSPPPNSTQTNPLDEDTDRDGLRDKFERDNKLDATDDGSIDPNNGPNGDPDGDGISNLDQQAAENLALNSSDYSIQSEVRFASFGGSIVTRPSGEKRGTGAFDGNSPGSHAVYHSLEGIAQVTKNNFISQLEALPYLSIDDFSEQQQENLDYPFQVNSFSEDQPYTTGLVAYHSDAGSSYLTGVGEPYTHESDASPSTIETLVGTSRQTRFRIKAARADHPPFVANYLKIDSKQVGFHHYVYGLQEEITKVEPYIIRIPEGELYSEWHEFKTELVDGYLTNVRLIPVEVVPDDNMAGIIGDVVKSAATASTVKHFVTPKKSTELQQDYVELKAVGMDTATFSRLLEWEGGEAGSTADKRKVKRDTVGKTEVKIKAKQGGAVAAEIHVWVVWTSVTTTNGTPVFKEKPNPDGASKYEIVQTPATVWRFKFKIEPFAICDPNLDEKPNLTGDSEKDVPGNGNIYTLDPSRGDADTAIWKWDTSRKMSVTIRNPNGIPKAQIQSLYGAAWAKNQPVASDNPVDLPVVGAEGNDDPTVADEDGNPYESKNGDVANGNSLDHAIGEITSIDAPRYGAFSSWGAAGRTFAVEVNFREFARLEIWDGNRTTGTFWYRISDFSDWHHYFNTAFDDTQNLWKNAGSSSGNNHPRN